MELQDYKNLIRAGIALEKLNKTMLSLTGASLSNEFADLDNIIDIIQRHTKIDFYEALDSNRTETEIVELLATNIL